MSAVPKPTNYLHPAEPNREPLLVKVCGMRDYANIAAVIGLKPDYMGFIFYPESPRCVPPDADLPNLPDGIKKVGVFVNADLGNVIALARVHELDIIQLHGTEPPGYCDALKVLGFTVFKAFGIRHAEDLEATAGYESGCALFVFDTKSPKHGGTGQQFDWNVLHAYTGSTPFLLSGGIGPADAEAIRALSLPKLAGVDLNSRFELEPGLKNTELLAPFINAMKSNG